MIAEVADKKNEDSRNEGQRKHPASAGALGVGPDLQQERKLGGRGPVDGGANAILASNAAAHRAEPGKSNEDAGNSNGTSKTEDAGSRVKKPVVHEYQLVPPLEMKKLNTEPDAIIDDGDLELKWRALDESIIHLQAEAAEERQAKHFELHLEDPIADQMKLGHGLGELQGSRPYMVERGSQGLSFQGLDASDNLSAYNYNN